MSIRTRKTLQAVAWGIAFIAALTVENMIRDHGHFWINWPLVAVAILAIITAVQRWWLYGPSAKAAEKRAQLEEQAERNRNRRARGITR